jgi:hypothetical protein
MKKCESGIKGGDARGWYIGRSGGVVKGNQSLPDNPKRLAKNPRNP